MEKITLHLNRFAKKSTGPRSEREELVQKFADRINAARAQAGYKPLPIRAIAVKLGHVATEDLYPFYRECEKARSFSAFFWYALRPDRRL